jgi:transposase
MEPVVGLDVSKGTSMAQAFTARNEANGKSRCIVHTEKGFEGFGEWLGELRQKTGKEPSRFRSNEALSSGASGLHGTKWFCHMVINPL